MKEEEIRKRDIFNKYLELLKEDIEKFFPNDSSFFNSNCPACDSSDSKFEFEKHKFCYVSCKQCSTLYVSPRPTLQDLKRFYTNSASTSFWVNEFFKPHAENRRKLIFRPRAEYVYQLLSPKSNSVIGDIGAGFGIFLEELAKYYPEARYVAIEPSVKQAQICRDKGINVLTCVLEEVDDSVEKFNLLTAFELFEHLFCPYDFLCNVYRLLKPDGHFLMTTLNPCGFDIQLLWEKSKSLSPPHHLNFFNPNSIVLLFKRCGFEVIEVSTPGRLDWDIVEGMIKKENTDLGRFWNLIANTKDEKCKSQLQQWISNNNLSSHMRVVAKK
jgi:SAM-dependent methyltransferase